MPISAFACCKEPALASDWGLSEEDVAFVIDRYRRPEPRSELALIVRNFAQGAIDVSDGLVGDVEKLAQRLPCRRRDRGGARAALAGRRERRFAHDPELLATLLTAGDDYEIVAAVPEASAPGLRGRGGSERA